MYGNEKDSVIFLRSNVGLDQMDIERPNSLEAHEIVFKGVVYRSYFYFFTEDGTFNVIFNCLVQGLSYLISVL